MLQRTSHDRAFHIGLGTSCNASLMSELFFVTQRTEKPQIVALNIKGFVVLLRNAFGQGSMPVVEAESIHDTMHSFKKLMAGRLHDYV